MKLLFDQNLSPYLTRRLADFYAGSAHVSELNLANAPDSEIWEHAKDGGYAIVSKDSNFPEMVMKRGFPQM